MSIVEQILDSFCSLPRVHGNGFIQVDLNEEGTTRLHVWDKAVPRQKVGSPLHDHVFDMESLVIAGTLEHIEYALCEPLDPNVYATYEIHQATQEEGTQNTYLKGSGEIVSVVCVERRLVPAGMKYTFPAGAFHDSRFHGTTATIMKKRNAPGDYGRPRVLVPVGLEPDNEFKRDGHDQAALVDIILRALELASAMETLPEFWTPAQ